MLEVFSFAVEGEPEGQGSMTPFYDRRAKRTRVKHGPRLEAWRDKARYTAVAARNRTRDRRIPRDRPVSIRVTFYCHQPVTPKYPFPVKDLDKLCRALGDALTGVLYDDDSQVIEWRAVKVYDKSPRTEVVVYA